MWQKSKAYPWISAVYFTLYCCGFCSILRILAPFNAANLQPSYSTSFLCGKHANKGHFTSFYVLWILNPCWKKWYTVLSSTAGWPNAGRSNSEVQIAESRSCRQVNRQMMSGHRNPEGPDSRWLGLGIKVKGPIHWDNIAAECPI